MLNTQTFNRILFEEMNKVSPTMLDKLHATIDKSKLWDGKHDATSVRDTDRYGGGKLFSHNILLSFGGLRVTYGTDAKNEVRNLEFSYHLPQIAPWFQPLYRNRIERDSSDSNNFDTEIKARKFIVKRYKDLLTAVLKWFETCNINTAITRVWALPNDPDVMGTNSHIRYLMGTIGQMRLCAELHKERCALMGVSTNADRIAELANELDKEINIQLESSPIFKRIEYLNSY